MQSHEKSPAVQNFKPLEHLMTNLNPSGALESQVPGSPVQLLTKAPVFAPVRSLNYHPPPQASRSRTEGLNGGVLNPLFNKKIAVNSEFDKKSINSIKYNLYNYSLNKS